MTVITEPTANHNRTDIQYYFTLAHVILFNYLKKSFLTQKSAQKKYK